MMHQLCRRTTPIGLLLLLLLTAAVVAGGDTQGQVAKAEQPSLLISPESEHLQENTSTSNLALEEKDHRQLQDEEEEEEEEDDDVSGNLFFGTITVCHLRFWGFFNDDEYETAQVWSLFNFLHAWHGDLPGTCESRCSEICQHKACFDDFDLFDGKSRCDCIRNVQSSRCGANTDCVSDECKCKAGYTGSALDGCSDVNECQNANLNNCGPNTSCSNEPGSFKCECKSGYDGNPTSSLGCTDIDECAEDPDRCGSRGGQPLGTCQNSDGTFTCDCVSGYVFDRDLGRCRDVNECTEIANACGPNAECTNRQGTFSCTCLDGFSVADGGKPSPSNPCNDIDECSANPNLCGQNATCSNAPPGSFTCTCDRGFLGNPPSDSCEPDACTAAGIFCVVDAVCDTSGSPPQCRCPSGYEGDGTVQCDEINECQRGTDNCGVNEECFNRPPGSFECLIKAFRPCPTLGNDADCIDGLQCAKTSRSDDRPICCAETGLCLDQATECCNGAYNQGESCPSQSSNDCRGDLTCGREIFNDRYRCCTETQQNDLLGFRECTRL